MPGNWVNDHELGEHVEISYASDDEYQGTKHGYWREIGDLSGIPITAVILKEWFGFGSCVQGEFTKAISGELMTIDRFSENGISKWGLFREESQAHLCSVEFVHQLQQLYEALTGEQLERQTKGDN